MEQEELRKKQVPTEIIEKIVSNYQEQVDHNSGQLYNKFVGFISEARIPIAQVILVLTLLLEDAKDIAKKKCFGTE